MLKFETTARGTFKMNRKVIKTLNPRGIIRRHGHVDKISGIKETNAFAKCDRAVPNSGESFIESRVRLPPSEGSIQSEKSFRVNSLNIQMLSRSLFKQIFGKVEHRINRDEKLVEKSLMELKQHGLPGPLQKVPDIDLKLPDILNGDIEEHFYELGRQQSESYKLMTDRLLNPIPPAPLKWNFCSGWTKYVDGKSVSVDYPDEECLIFDVEVCCGEGETPVMATAVSPTHWYSWVSKDLCARRKAISKKKINRYSTDDLIPLESAANAIGYDLDDRFSTPKIVIGHNISFDRARIKEQYWLERTALRFIDTMSLHIAISGVTSYQKLMLKTGSAKEEPWSEVTSVNNSLKEVYKFYCGGDVKKEDRNVFLTGSLKDVRDDFQNLMTYCAKDVEATHKVLTHLWPEFLKRFPHPVTLAGMLELSVCYLPINRNWNTYVENAQQTYDDLNVEAKLLLSQMVDKSCQLLHNERYKSDLWLWSENWKLKPFKLNKEKLKAKRKTQKSDDQNVIETNSNRLATAVNSAESEMRFDRTRIEKLQTKFAALIETGERIPARIPHLAGYPEWYRKLCTPPRTTNWSPGPQLISTSMKVVPKLLSLTWNYMPLHHIKEHGWCYIVPYETQLGLHDVEAAIFPSNEFILYYLKMKDADRIQDCEIDVEKVCEKLRQYARGDGKLVCGLKKLPHKNGAELNVGNPLAKDFVNKFSDAEMKGSSENAVKIIEISRQLSYWKNNRDRIANQFIVWLKDENLPGELRSSSLYQNELGVILPMVVVCGTLTRRATESTWMTASNATDERVGSELRAMIQAPPGYCIVGADVDSQELWIASLIGDSYRAKEHGCTPFGWMTLSGQKADRTDMHSVTANTMGISRSDAKIINYARIYGAGEKFANRLLNQFIPGVEEKKAALIARKMLQNTKGNRIYELKPDVLVEHRQRTFTRTNARQLCTLYNKHVDELFQKPKWRNGSESAMFNSLEEIACSAEPKTPLLGACLTKALEPTASDDQKFMPTRINWVVQSSAVDFLHLLLVCMRWLVGSKTRFCLSFHDEVRYLVPENQKYQVALALHVSNLLTRCFCVQRLGMCDLPQSVAFFSSVEVDTVLRKESTDDCVTPSNPYGLSKVYGISPGESLNIVDSIRKANAKVGNLE